MIFLKQSLKLKLPFYIFIFFCLLFICLTSISYQKVVHTATSFSGQETKTIILDPGHGGEDGGAVSINGTMEKDINLEISKYLKDMLLLSGYQVIMTRETDISICDDNLDTIRERKVSDLHNRLKILDSSPEALFISIHQNHFSQEEYYGTQVFVSPNNGNSQLLGDCIRDEVICLLQPENTRELKTATNSIYLLWNCKNPSALIECGFLSNPSESKLLEDPVYQKQMAFAIFQGILRYESQDTA